MDFIFSDVGLPRPQPASAHAAVRLHEGVQQQLFCTTSLALAADPRQQTGVTASFPYLQLRLQHVAVVAVGPRSVREGVDSGLGVSSASSVNRTPTCHQRAAGRQASTVSDLSLSLYVECWTQRDYFISLFSKSDGGSGVDDRNDVEGVGGVLRKPGGAARVRARQHPAPTHRHRCRHNTERRRRWRARSHSLRRCVIAPVLFNK